MRRHGIGVYSTTLTRSHHQSKNDLHVNDLNENTVSKNTIKIQYQVQNQNILKNPPK